MHEDLTWFIGLVLIIGMVAFGSWSVRKKGAATEDISIAETSEAVEDRPISEDAVRERILQAQEQVNKLQEDILEAQAVAKASPLRGKILIQSASPGSVGGNEYVILEASGENTSAVTVSGLRIQGAKSRLGATIPKGWRLPYPGTRAEGDPVSLRPGEIAYVITGRSANAMSFQTNACTGYFENGTTFDPPLPLSCPRPIDEPTPLPPNQLSDACLGYLEGLPTCGVPGDIPDELRSDGNCVSHLTTKISYDRCVSLHRNEPGFFSGEWRLFLGRGGSLWPLRHDTIELVDQQGKLIHSYSY